MFGDLHSPIHFVNELYKLFKFYKFIMEYEILKTYCICEKTYSQHCTEWLNTKNFSLKIRNKPRILTFTTSINIILKVLEHLGKRK